MSGGSALATRRVRTATSREAGDQSRHEIESGDQPQRCSRSFPTLRHCRRGRTPLARESAVSNCACLLISSGQSEAAARPKALSFAALEPPLTPASCEPLRWFVPGRIEVLGKHTDYAGGRSLLCTAERGFCVAASPRADSEVSIHDVVRHKSVQLTLSPHLLTPHFGWNVYPSLVVRRVARNCPGSNCGADIVFASDLPSAAGMSSSSALVVAIFAVLSAVNRLTERPEYTTSITTPEDLAGYLGCIENGQTYKSLAGDRGVGTFGGSEDHTAILTSQPRHLKQYSFCPVRFERSVKVPDDCVFVIVVSGVVADTTGSAKELYNRASLGVRSILDVWRKASGSSASTLAEAATASPAAPDQLRTALRRANSAGANWLLNPF